MFKRLFGKIEMEFSLIAIGDFAGKMGVDIINSMKEYDAKVHSLWLRRTKQKNLLSKKFDNEVSFEEDLERRPKRVDDYKNNIDTELEEKIRKNTQKIIKKENKFTMILVSSGTFSSGVGLWYANYLKEKFGIVPVVLYIYPDLSEPATALLNSSEFLFYALYSEKALNLPVILYDSSPGEEEKSLSFEEFVAKKNNLLAITLRDLIISSYLPSISEDYKATLNNLVEVLTIKGLSIIVSRTIGKLNEKQKAVRVNDLIIDSVHYVTKIKKEEIYKAKGAYIAWFNVELDFQTNFEAKKLSSSFEYTRPYLKFISEEEVGERALRAIISGLEVAPRIVKTMQQAKYAKKELLVREGLSFDELQEFSLQNIEKINTKIENLVFEAVKARKQFKP